MSRIPFAEVTESVGIPVSSEAASMMVTRYRYAAALARGRDVLELACGSGVGLGMLARSARSVVGADIDPVLLDRARANFAATVPLLRLSAAALPLRTNSFDVVLFLEASYYVKDLERALCEIARVLRPGGHVMFVNANPDRPDFIRSPHSHHYHTADEFRALLHGTGFDVTTAAAFPLEETASSTAGRLLGRVVSAARTALNAFGLIPTTMVGRARLKRLLLRPLRPLPAELTEGFAPSGDVTSVPTGPVRTHKVIYVTGEKRVNHSLTINP